MATSLNKAGQDPFASALNYYALQSGAIRAPSADVVNSARSYNPLTAGESEDHPIQSANGLWVSSKSGQPWHGSYQGSSGASQYFSNGKQVQDIGQVGVQTPNISVQQIQKNPQLSAQVGQAIQANAGATQMLSKSFNDYLAEANKSFSGLSASATQAQQDLNPQDTINRVNNDVSTVRGQLSNTENTYEQGQQKALQDLTAANQGYKTTQDQALAKLGEDLRTQNAQYADASRAVARQAYDQAMKQNALYHLTSGTPTSGSGNMDNRAIAAYENVNIPLERELAARNQAITNQLYGTGSDLANRYLGNDQSRLAQTMATNSDVANRQNQMNQYTAQLDQSTAQYIQGLRQQVASMRPQVALQYLQAMGIPIQTAQSIISGNTANLAGLAQLDQAANFYNLVTPYQNNAPTFISPSVSLPGYATGGTSTGGGYSGVASALQSQLSDYQNANSSWLATPQGQAWIASRRSPTRTATAAAPGYGPNGNFAFDQNTGLYTDPQGNQYTNTNGAFEAVTTPTADYPTSPYTANLYPSLAQL